MFLGHYAVAMAAKRLAPNTSLGTLFAAGLFLDLLWPVLVIAGIERVTVQPGITRFTPLDFQHYPYSHSLLMSVLWALLFAGGYWLYKRSTSAALVVGALVISHWLLDAVMHRPDLPLDFSAEIRIGLGLWNSVAITLILELALFAIGIALYVHATAARDRSGTVGLMMFIIFLLLIYAGAAFGPPPPGAQAVAFSGMAQWLMVALGAWLDRHRAVR